MNRTGVIRAGVVGALATAALGLGSFTAVTAGDTLPCGQVVDWRIGSVVHHNAGATPPGPWEAELEGAHYNQTNSHTYILAQWGYAHLTSNGEEQFHLACI